MSDAVTRWPDFFIVGAPKCGTTALYSYLAEHPDVFLPSNKEPHYFADDLASPYYVRSEAAYRALFAAAGEHQSIGEASVWYLFSEVAPTRIRDAVPGARLIVMVRRPVELFLSLHNQTLMSHYEDESDPEKAWHLQTARRRGERIPKLCEEPRLLQYDDACRLGGQLERLLQVFPRSHVHVVVFDDLAAGTRSVYEDVLRFLDLASDGREEFPRVNEAHQSRLRWLEAARRRTDRTLVTTPILTRTLRWFGPFRPLSRTLRRFNVQKVEKPTLEEGFHRLLTEHFAKDVEILERLLERDLTAWKDPAAPAAGPSGQAGRRRRAR